MDRRLLIKLEILLNEIDFDRCSTNSVCERVFVIGDTLPDNLLNLGQRHPLVDAIVQLPLYGIELRRVR